VTQSKFIQLYFHIDETLNNLNLPTVLRKNIYLIAKEAVNNAVKYSGCKKLFVKLERQKKLLLAEIQDDGNGFDITKASDGNGLKNMHYRATQIQAEFLIESSAGKGTRVCLKKKINFLQ
jgi:signal transduction histidine kinase